MKKSHFDLDWFYNVEPSALGLQAQSIDSLFSAVQLDSTSNYVEDQMISMMRSARRSRKIYAALSNCSAKTKAVIHCAYSYSMGTEIRSLLPKAARYEDRLRSLHFKNGCIYLLLRPDPITVLKYKSKEDFAAAIREAKQELLNAINEYSRVKEELDENEENYRRTV